MYISCTFSTGSQAAPAAAVTTSPDGSAPAHWQGSGLVAPPPPPHAQTDASNTEPPQELDFQQLAASLAHETWPHAYTPSQWQVVAPPVVPSSWWQYTLSAVIPRLLPTRSSTSL
ncbi:hypothetical protein EXIGLDRAFT_773089 [Exidia glandulosa HHB12029]|uniref:Uncharacterized protein n=1 Tax=Exidia glandulosa HHB12029 TaxID=1314781 RepID=A0A165EZ99_EXIGL|nr:hypothetical protein EXIGLDRAFT_773089 [Exidia glandulosa HHB12029]